MAMKEYSTFPKSLRLVPCNLIVFWHIHDTHCGGASASYSSAEMQWLYSTAPADLAAYYSVQIISIELEDLISYNTILSSYSMLYFFYLERYICVQTNDWY